MCLFGRLGPIWYSLERHGFVAVVAQKNERQYSDSRHEDDNHADPELGGVGEQRSQPASCQSRIRSNKKNQWGRFGRVVLWCWHETRDACPHQWLGEV
jgi:hypothetical protein